MTTTTKAHTSGTGKNPMEMEDPAVTVAEAKAWLKANYDKRDGCLCPACGQTVRLSTRSISPKQVRDLKAINDACELSSGGWVNVSAIASVRGGDYAKLRFWGLLAQHEERAGRWRVTLLGKQFLAGKATVNRHVFVYNNRVRAYSDDRVSIRDVVGGNETLPDSLLANDAPGR